jgi:uncharacterized protein YciI
MITAFAAYCRDGPDAPRLREEHLRAHLDHVERHMDRLLVAGPLKDESGAFTGSLILFGVSSATEARALIGADPYFDPGVWSEVRIERFLAVAGHWVGGRAW